MGIISLFIHLLQRDMIGGVHMILVYLIHFLIWVPIVLHRLDQINPLHFLQGKGIQVLWWKFFHKTGKIFF